MNVCHFRHNRETVSPYLTRGTKRGWSYLSVILLILSLFFKMLSTCNMYEVPMKYYLVILQLSSGQQLWNYGLQCARVYKRVLQCDTTYLHNIKFGTKCRKNTMTWDTLVAVHHIATKRSNLVPGFCERANNLYTRMSRLVISYVISRVHGGHTRVGLCV